MLVDIRTEFSVITGTSAGVACTSAGTICTSTAAARNFLVATAFLAAALRFLVFAAFLPADLSFRVRAAFFAAKLRFVGMGIPLVTGVIWRRSYNA